MPLDERIVRLLAKKSVIFDPELIDIAALRARARAQIAIWEEAGVTRYPVRSAENIEFAKGESVLHGRLYLPEGAQARSFVVYLHGGGWVVGDLDTHDGICRAICDTSGAAVLSVDYRLAPENGFPCAVQDGVAAVEWAQENAGSLGCAREHVFVAGDSSGGNLAAVVALLHSSRVMPPLAGQVLIYPATDSPDAGHHSLEDFGRDNDHGQNLVLYRRFVRLYLGERATPEHPLFAPMRFPSLDKAPASLTITAEYDLLRDEGEAYARRLAREAGGAQTRRYEGVSHGFLHLVGLLPAADEACRQIGSWIRARSDQPVSGV